MTKSEAIEQIKWYFEMDDGIAADDATKRAISMAINALEEQPRPIDPTVEVDLASGAVPRSALNQPKVTIHTDRPKGHWIKRLGSINCSVCKHSNWSDSFEDLVRSFNYCPNCGARMKGADDD